MWDPENLSQELPEISAGEFHGDKIHASPACHSAGREQEWGDSPVGLMLHSVGRMLPLPQVSNMDSPCSQDTAGAKDCPYDKAGTDKGVVLRSQSHQQARSSQG